MKMVGIGVAALVAVVVVLVGIIFAASEFGGEVVKLRTTDATGAVHETSLWVADDDGAVWLRAGDPASGWLARLKEKPEVELERAGQTGRYRARAVPEKSARLNELLAERYGWANWIIDTTMDVSDATAVRLDPLP